MKIKRRQALPRFDDLVNTSDPLQQSPQRRLALQHDFPTPLCHQRRIAHELDRVTQSLLRVQ